MSFNALSRPYLFPISLLLYHSHVDQTAIARLHHPAKSTVPRPRNRKEKVRVGTDWDYSRTTMKYVGQFLGQNTAKTRKDIEKGDIILDSTLYVGAKKSQIIADIKEIVEDDSNTYNLDKLFKELKYLLK